MANEKVAKAYLKYARISPRKVSSVLDLIRGKDVGTAVGILMNTRKATSNPYMDLWHPAKRFKRIILTLTSGPGSSRYLTGRIPIDV